MKAVCQLGVHQGFFLQRKTYKLVCSQERPKKHEGPHLSIFGFSLWVKIASILHKYCEWEREGSQELLRWKLLHLEK